MEDPENAATENICKGLSQAFQGLLSWKWDGRLEAVLAEFAAKKKEAIRPILEKYLPVLWTGPTIAGAPGPVREVNARLGGLREGQLFFSSGPGEGAFVYCAWWPWGDGKTISVRIASFSPDERAAEKDERSRRLKSWFGI